MLENDAKKESPWSPTERFVIRIVPSDTIISYTKKRVKTKTARGVYTSGRYVEKIEEADPSSAIRFYTNLAAEYDRNYSGPSGVRAEQVFRDLKSSAVQKRSDNYFMDRVGASILYEKEIDVMKEYARMAEEYDKIYKGLINNQHIRSMPDTFIVEIGVFNKIHKGIKGTFSEITHYDEDGNIDNKIRRQNTWAHPRIRYIPVKERTITSDNLDYEKLFELLYHLGFDPLSAIRHKRKTIVDNLTALVTRIVKNGNASKQNITAELDLEVQDLVWDVKEYIIGGEKPMLKDSTVEHYRPNKLEMNGTLYPRGIEEPLMESGQLHDAITYKITPVQSGLMSKYIDDIRKNLLTSREAEYLRKLRKWKRVGIKPRRYRDMLGIKSARLNTSGYLENKVAKLLQFDTREKGRDRFSSKTKEGRIGEIQGKIGKTKTLLEIFEAEYKSYINMKKSSRGNKIVELDYLIQGNYSSGDLEILKIAGRIYPNLVKQRFE